jgi:hypothetical protein
MSAPKTPEPSPTSTALIRCTVWLGCLGLAIVSPCIFFNGVQFPKHLLSNRISAQKSSPCWIGVLEIFGRLGAIGPPSLPKPPAIPKTNVLSNLQRLSLEFVASTGMDPPEVVPDGRHYLLAHESNIAAKESPTLGRRSANTESVSDKKADKASEAISENRFYHYFCPIQTGVIALFVGYFMAQRQGSPTRRQ